MDCTPPFGGRSLLLPNIITSCASQTPSRTFAYLPSGPTLASGFRSLSYASLARGVNKTAFWLDAVFGRREEEPGSGHERTVAYIGPNDLRYALLLLGCVKSRRRIFIPLPANTPSGLAKLLRAQGCKEVFAAKESAESWDEALKLMEESVKVVVVPTLEDMLGENTGEVEEYQYERSEEEGLDDTIMVIQTSGTTGDPKAIHGPGHMIRTWNELRCTVSTGQPDATMSLAVEATIPIFFPISWSAGLAYIVIYPLVAGTIPILLPTSAPQPMTAEYTHQVNELAPRGDKNGAIFVPMVLRELAQDKSKLELLGQRYDWIGYAGAPLETSTGNLIRNYVNRLQSFMGSSDTGMYPFVQNDPEDWELHRIPESPNRHGFHWQPFIEGEGLYELCITRQPGEYRHAIVTHPDPHLQIYHTKDLFRIEPGRQGLFRSAGRVDDFVKLSNLTKFNAIAIEQMIDTHPEIKASLVAGDGKPKPFVIVQLEEMLYRDQGLSREEILARLWPVFDQVNERLSEDAKLTKDLILLLEPGETFQRTGKGTISRRTTLELFREMVNDVYVGTGFGFEQDAGEKSKQ